MELNLTGAYPIILDGEKTGEIKVSREGLFWRFEGKNKMCDELLRISVYGDGREGYLGLMEPCGDEMVLVKKFSRSALKAFPKTISYAARRGQALDALPESSETPEQAEVSSVIEPTASPPPIEEKCAISEDDSPPNENKPPPDDTPSPQEPNCEWLPCACPCSLFKGLEAKSITSSIHGTMMRQGEDGVLLAIPSDTASLLPETDFLNFIEKKDIYGFSYYVYRV
ncbi:MAG: hypothetical protein GX025_06570 [Clostridiales bacterium]|nr:hypothetical protein [Clostridiales bacterium]